jgi:hypothetical protein
MPLTNAEVDSAVPAAGEPNRALTNAALKELIADIVAAIATAQARAGHTGTQLAATVSDFSAAADARVAAAAATGAGSLVRDTGPVLSGATAAADPSVALGLATKQYVDGIAANLGKRQRVRAATVANITIATALNNGDSLDGVTLVTGDLVLVKDQTAPAENGVYVVGVSPARAAEFDAYDEYPGSLIAVQEGTVHADDLFLCTSNVGGTIGVTGIVFAAFSAPTDAASVSVADAGGYFAGVNVETVLQELGASLAGKVDALAAVTITASTNLTRASHANRLLICNSGSAINLTIEDDTTGGWGASDYFPVLNIGAGTVTIQGDGTAVVTAVPGFALTIPQNGIGAAQRSGANAWSAYGQLAVQAQATWEAGVGTTESVISPAKLAAAIAALAPAGGAVPYQDAKTWFAAALLGATAHTAVGIGAVVAYGSSAGTTAPWNTDRGWERVPYDSTAAANSSAGLRGPTNMVLMPGADARANPVTFRGVIGTDDAQTGARGFLGLRNGTADPGASEPSALLNTIGIGYDSDMSQYVFMHNDGSGVATEVVLNGGTGFPCNTDGTDRIELELALTGQGGAQTVHYRVTNLDSGVTVSGTVTTNLPASGTILTLLGYRNTGAGTTAVTCALGDFRGGSAAGVTAGA